MSNAFKQAIADGRPQFGLWLGLPCTESTEIVAAAGFDWLVVDGEHGPFDFATVRSQLLAVAAHPGVEPVVRVPTGRGATGETELKRCLDLGARTVLVPMVESAEQAREVVRYCRYPPSGTRGVAPARAAAWGRDREYFAEADRNLCVLVQVETVDGLAALDEIARVDGVDGVFFGPADLSASFGMLGEPDAAQVREAVETGIVRVRTLGRAAGVLTRRQESAERYLAAGATFVAVGSDASLLVDSSDRLRAAYR